MTSSDIRSVEPDTPDYVHADWDRYRQLSTLINHWDRPGWTDGRRSYHWIVRFDDCPVVRALTAHCQDHLRHLPTLDLVPATSLHMTLQRVAFIDQITTGDARVVAAAARERYADMPPVTTTIGPLAGSAGAVRFSAGPHRPLRRIRSVARAAIVAVRGTDADSAPAADFIPHVSIAYNNTPIGAQPIIEQVATLRSLAPVTVQIRAVDLVELRRDGPSYVWSPVVTVPLTGQPHV
jgi:2'-5' RNA ligase